MITVTVIEQDAGTVVLEGADDTNPQLNERWTITNQAIADVPGLLIEKRDMLLLRMYAKLDAWNAAQEAVNALRTDEF